MDGERRVLLMQWHDTVSGKVFWEPPGGGLEAGETPIDAARRELTEETGLPGEAVSETWISVDRDSWWLGERFVKAERFYLAVFDRTPRAAPTTFTAEENDTFMGYGWFSPAEIHALADVEPPELPAVVERLLGASRIA
ncbi:hypothetical protein Ssi02_18960 [Sinosporangium siamense]|uniref:Nudix hydrolase domain-containing protein n=1 Tax=Sinosporangium siamense TaxID=1367973 RepID=A0A919V472_9ACTN|nr:hypothetical protein Ssi02_18960 [Sinosporangium siamense]